MCKPRKGGGGERGGQNGRGEGLGLWTEKNSVGEREKGQRDRGEIGETVTGKRKTNI